MPGPQQPDKTMVTSHSVLLPSTRRVSVTSPSFTVKESSRSDCSPLPISWLKATWKRTAFTQLVRALANIRARKKLDQFQ